MALAAIGTLSFGAVLGPEGPLIALGAVVGILIISPWSLTGLVSLVLALWGATSVMSSARKALAVSP